MDFDELNPYSVTLYFLCVLIFTMVFMHPLFIIINIICSFIACYCIDRNGFFTSLKYKLFFSAVITFLNPLFTAKGNTVLFRVFNRPYTMQALVYGFILAGIFVCSINWFSCFGRLIGTDKFMYMMAGRFPVLCSLLSMITGLIPYFENRLYEISQIQNTLFDKNKPYRNVFNSFNTALSFAFEHAVSLSFSMKNRGFGVTKQTHYKSYSFGKQDFLLCILSVVCFCAVVSFAYSMATDISIIPEIVLISPHMPEYAGIGFFILLLLLPSMFYIYKEIRWNYLMSEN